MAVIGNNQLILKMGPAEGDHAKAIQEAFILAIEVLAKSDYSQDDYCRDAISIFSDLLRKSLLDKDQMKLSNTRLFDYPENIDHVS